jgi:hypothetical protein
MGKMQEKLYEDATGSVAGLGVDRDRQQGFCCTRLAVTQALPWTDLPFKEPYRMYKIKTSLFRNYFCIETDWVLNP